MAKKRMPVNVLEESSAGGAGKPVLDDLVGGREPGSGAERPMSDETHAKVEARRLGRARGDVRTWALGSLLVGLMPCWSLAFLVLAVVLFSLTRSLGRRYGGDAAWELGRPFLGAVIGAGLALHLAAYLACWLPLLGSHSDTLWTALASAGAVSVVGRLFIKHYEAGGTLLGLDVARMHRFFRDKYGRE
ncbi:MAG: hypothetical protein P1P84_14950 [Deferrisomatales bacterium]|nr:hypothetical protein [Deferrisomatales bacterium]